MLDRPAEANPGPSPTPRGPPPAAGAVRPHAPVRLGAAALTGILRRRKWAVILPIVLTPLLAVVALRQLHPRYTATGTVLYEPAGFSARELQSILRVDPTTDPMMASQVDIVRSLPNAARLADRFGLAESAEFNWRLRRSGLLLRTVRDAALWVSHLAMPQQVPPPAATLERESVVQAVQAALVVRNLKQTHLMEVSFSAQDPSVAAAAVNLAMSLYIASQLDAKSQAVRQASEWLGARVAELRSDVLAADDRIAAYRAGHGLVQGVQAGIGTEQISRIESDLLQARSDLAQAKGRLEVARGRRGAAAQAAIATSVVQLRGQRELIAAQFRALRTRLGASHPEVLTANGRLAAIDEAVTGEIARVVAASEADVRAGETRIATLEQSRSAALAELGRDGVAEIPLRAMERDAEAARTLLQAVLERAQQTAQQAAIELPDARIISPAPLPEEPSFPRAKLMLAAACAFGLCFGLLLAWLLELADTTFRGGEDVRRRLGLPCLALVPQVRRRVLGGMRVAEYGAHKPLSPFAEQLRALRAGLWLRSRQPKVVAITAARPAEGKTTVTMALARSAAINGERVLVIDCDIRQPALAQLLEADGAAGLVDCLLGHSTLEAVIRTDALTGADILPAGSPEVNAASLFASDTMAGVLVRLRAEYDLVLLDAPPALAMTDARLLAHLADATLMCVRWRHTPSDVVCRALELLEEAGAEIAGVALTRVDARTHVRAGFADSEIYHPRYGGYFRE